MNFDLHSDYAPAGDQPAAIAALVAGLKRGQRFQTLRGVTGSGKTFTAASVIAAVNRPALVVSQNKTLAAQLYSELKAFFPNNRVEYFVSYYDYYQPEAYIPSTDTYIAKDSAINDEIEKFRLSATTALLERHDVIVVASVSCIYGLGTPAEILKLCVPITVGAGQGRDKLLRALIQAQYSRNDIAATSGEFSVSGDTVNIHPAWRDEYYRVEFFGDEVDSITLRDPLSRKLLDKLNSVTIFPATHYAASRELIDTVVPQVMKEMEERVAFFESKGRLVEAQRLSQRTVHDMEMLREIGHCQGIENYSRYLTGREPGERPFCLLDFFPKDFITIVDESHVTLPQFRAMYNGDQSRKNMLVEHGFRLPSALDNRPMKFEEFEAVLGQTIFVSATPADYENCGGPPVELVVRPTGLVDPPVEIRPLANQLDDLVEEIHRTIENGGRVLAAALTKKTAEDLADWLKKIDIKATYLHSDVDTLDRIETLRDLRSGVVDVLIGINLLREGVDLPEVKLVAILDADKEGFLRSTTALIQLAGRAARNAEGRCLLYADKKTDSLKEFLRITDERRSRQEAYNREHGITPRSVIRGIQASLHNNDEGQGSPLARPAKKKGWSADEVAEEAAKYGADELQRLRTEMLAAAAAMEFERAAQLRDRLKALERGEDPNSLIKKSRGRKK